MPLSAQEYDALARKVAETAPPGLSRDEFYALVDKAAASQDTLKAAPQQEGRLGLFTSPIGPEITKGQNALESVSHPGLNESPWMAMIRGGLSGAGSGALDVLRGATTPASLALQAATAGALKIPAVGALASEDLSIPGLTRFVGRGLKNYDVTRPAKPIGDLLEWLASKPVPKSTGAPPRLVKGPSTLSDALTGAVNDVRGSQAPPSVSVPPPQTMTAAGKPSVTAAQQDVIQGSTAKPPASSTVPTTSKAPAVSDRRMAELVEKFGGKPSPGPSSADLEATNVPSGNMVVNPGEARMVPTERSYDAAEASRLTGDLPTDLKTLRREYGATDLGAHMNPQAPEAAVGEILRQTNAPSAMPDRGGRVFLKHLQDPSSVKDTAAFHRALVQQLKELNRNGGPADSPTARQIYLILKKYGYEVP